MSRRGWHHRGYLPHYDADAVVQHVVFRLADSLPRETLHLLSVLGKLERVRKINEALDEGLGGATLADHRVGRIVEEALLHFDGERYALYAWCVMPNHVHVVVEAFPGCSISNIVRGWKAFSAARVNRLLGRSGRLWAPDYFDRFMRNEAHFLTTISYVENNPVAARLCGAAGDWELSSARRRLGGADEVRA